ncbi:glycosyltransferase [Thioclava sp. F36-7]|uniref:glycosyltransferase family 2 protein n=1 Tax=Thioclava sp. F36-7 TaxID=1915317 RepID=UPI0009989D74|nr:glycosyltransferase [Thioclava sp. F36-7]OOY10034.1 hypothetical protein BMI89_04305 [Thioclava sp. F36-7]
MTNPTRKEKIGIGLCTYRREIVRDTLASLAETLPPDLDICVIVADNDLEPSSEDRVRSVPLPFELHYLHAPAHNISIARNAVLDAAEAQDLDCLAFLDDDERALPGWLPALMEARQSEESAAVIGPVRAYHNDAAPEWMRAGHIHDTLAEHDSEGRVRAGYTCNVLLDLKHPAVSGLRFDPEFGRSGGEDTIFFDQIKRRGGTLAYAPDAWLEEDVPAERARLSWLFRRRFRMGQTHAVLVSQGKSFAARMIELGRAGAKALACLGLSLGHVTVPLARNRNLMRAALHIGVVWRLAGGSRTEIYGGASADATHNTASRRNARGTTS